MNHETEKEYLERQLDELHGYGIPFAETQRVIIERLDEIKKQEVMREINKFKANR